LVGESRAKFELLSQKASALDLDAVIARLVEKGDYKAEKAKRAADEYRKFLVLMGMGKTPLASKMVLDAWQAHVMPPALKTELVSSVGIARCLLHDNVP